MFGKKETQVEKKTVAKIKKDLANAEKKIDSLTPDLVVDKPVENAGMPGFTVDEKPAVATATEVIPVEDEGIPGFGSIGAPAPEPIAAPAVVEPIAAPAPVKAPAEQYQIIETGISPSEGLYVYKIVTNKYLGELGGVYEA
ncbi:hypothetical protein LCGC14_0622510 [marine sediment metagenome]|uniref:Uncharacterized protein n=1 Tax=marine sediment metagenome TaxID=412755 RepID=A0A0F9R4D5_9ZZZZ